MIGIGSKKIWSHISCDTQKLQYINEVRASEPKIIKNYPELVKNVASISFHNPQYAIFFRGQKRERLIKLKKGGLASSLYPSIYRNPQTGNKKIPLTNTRLKERFRLLKMISNEVLEYFRNENIDGYNKLKKFPELIWAIIQHYNTWDTPLLDITHSLRVAASFSLFNEGSAEGVLYVIGLPNISSSITYSVEEELLNIRLMSICPPFAQRPYFQEGYLVGSFPSQVSRKHPRLDVAKRILAKYKLIKKNFWSDAFPAIPNVSLKPEDDPLKIDLQGIKDTYDNQRI